MAMPVFCIIWGLLKVEKKDRKETEVGQERSFCEGNTFYM